MKTIEEIDMLVKSAAQKKANWLTDFMLVRPLTRAYSAQNAAYKAKIAKKKTTVAPTVRETQPVVNPRKDALTQIAQSASDAYQTGSLAKTKFVSGGKVVAR